MKEAALVLLILIPLTCSAAEMPLLVGGHAHGAKNVEILKSLGLGNFVWIPKTNYSMGNTPWNEEHDIFADVDACVEHDLHFIVSERRGLGTVLRPGGPEYGGDCSLDLHDEAAVRKFTELGRKLFVGLHAEEMDADMLQSALRMSFMSRVPELYDFTDRQGGREKFEGELSRLNSLYHSWGAAFIPNVCITSHLSGFRIGPDIVIGELLEHLPTTELQLGYLRGGHQQFGGNWGVWVSPWYRGEVPCDDKEIWPAKQAAIGGGHPTSYFKRCLYMSFISGARLLTMQETEPLFSPDGKGGYRLGPWGHDLKAFWEYARKHDAVFEPIVPTALLVDKDTGWSPKHLWGDWAYEERVWGQLPIQRGDKMLRAFLDLFLPGFHNKREPGAERKDGYPGYFAATPLGPFDIVASDISPQKLSKYPLVIVVGEIEMTPELLDTLRKYVRGGGTLLINAYQMRSHKALVQDEELLGVLLGNAGQGWTRMFVSNKIVNSGDVPGLQKEYTEPYFCSLEIRPGKAQILAKDGEGWPILLKHELGAGTVYLSTPEFMMEGYNDQNKRLKFFDELIPTLVKRSPVWVESEGDVSWLASRQGDKDVVVALANHSKSPRNARLLYEGDTARASLDVGTGQVSVAGDNGNSSFGITVAPQDVFVLRLTIQ